MNCGQADNLCPFPGSEGSTLAQQVMLVYGRVEMMTMVWADSESELVLRNKSVLRRGHAAASDDAWICSDQYKGWPSPARPTSDLHD